MGLGADWALDFLRRAQRVLAEHRIDLIELDRAIGEDESVVRAMADAALAKAGAALA